MRRPYFALRSLFIIPFLALVPMLLADEPAGAKKVIPSKFIRLQRDKDKKAVALETAVVRCKPGEGEGDLRVDLVGVVHVGDKGYYDKLNQLFEEYDVLLYELVAAQGTKVPKGGKKADNPLALLQLGLPKMLGLESQLDHIDYTAKNFVHADLSPQEMAEAIKKRGDNAVTLTLSVLADMLRQQNQPKKGKDQPKAEDLDPLALLLDPNAPNTLKRAFAEQLAESGEAGLGPTLNTILITDRNLAALKVLEREKAKGHKKIGIFYGAAHMPDFEKRLRNDYGLKRDHEQWLTAWDLTKERKGESPLEGILKLLK